MALLFPLMAIGNEPETKKEHKTTIELVLCDFVSEQNLKIVSYLIEDILRPEEVIPIEDWMFDELEKEDEPQIEDWMFGELK